MLVLHKKKNNCYLFTLTLGDTGLTWDKVFENLIDKQNSRVNYCLPHSKLIEIAE